ncbi:transmembrane amino acid transporter protein domain-containing protein [Phthorimaea operculella]|nr:transmembrane amino acid transporter protein domain-containing protein [Phthorimaea operculella]
MAATGSVLKFMAGYVDADDNTTGADFDPHDHRVIPKPTTYMDTMIHLLKGSIGAGILAMPQAMGRVGIIFATILLVLVGAFATFCIHILISTQYQLCKRHKRGYMAFSKSMDFGLRDGPPSMRRLARPLYWAVESMLVVWQLGICTIYFVFVGANLLQVCTQFGLKTNVRVIITIILIPMIIINLVKDLKMLAPMSMASNVIIFLGLILVAFYLMADDVHVTADKLKMKDWKEIPNFVGTALFALEAVGVVLALEYNMAHPKQFGGICGLFNIGMIVVIVLYAIVGIFGYLKYGAKIQSSITLNLPSNEKKAVAAKILFALSIFLSFPLQNFVAYSMLFRRLDKRYEAKGQGKCPRYIDYILRVMLVILPFLLAVAVPQLGPFITLFGALCLSMLAMIFPGLMHIAVRYPMTNGYGKMRWRLIGDIAIIVTGLVILVAGVITAVKEITDEFKKK